MTPPRRLAGTDGLMWHIETDPVLRSPILAVAVLEHAPPWPRVLALAEAAVEAFPALRQRVEARRWVDAPDFALTDHVRRTRLATRGSLPAVLAAVEPGVAAPFDPARPPWEWTLVEGLEARKAALVFRLHHSITDGVGGVGLAASLLFDGGNGSGPAPAATAVEAGAAHESLVGRLLRVPGAALRLSVSMVHELAPARGPLSPALRGRGVRRSLDTIDAPLDELRRAGRTAGGSVNDAFLAAVAGGMARYHDAIGAPVDALRFTMPVSLRRPLDPAGGNRFAPARFVMPIGGDVPRRIERAHVLAAQARSEPALPFTNMVAGALDVLPPRAAATLVGSMFKAVDVDAVDVPGVPGPVALGGAAVERLYAFAPPTGAALSVTLLSHGPIACIGVEADRAAVEDPALLRACLADALGEVLTHGAPEAHTVEVAT